MVREREGERAIDTEEGNEERGRLERISDPEGTQSIPRVCLVLKAAWGSPGLCQPVEGPISRDLTLCIQVTVFCQRKWSRECWAELAQEAPASVLAVTSFSGFRSQLPGP